MVSQPESKQPLRAAVIGAGMSGLFMAYQLQQAGLRFTVYEKRAAAGGTWDANTYPGLHVDVLTRNYEFPFARGHHWSKRYAPGAEVRSYLQNFAAQQGLNKHIRYNTEATSAVWTDGAWTLTLDNGDVEIFDIVVTATGFLRVPSIPRIAGADSFEGKSFHSSEWDNTIDLEDTSIRYAVIGTGSSGVQITSALGTLGRDVTQFIRHPQWMQVKDNPRYTLREKLTFRIPRLAKRYDAKMAVIREKTDGNETWRLVPGPDREMMKQRFLKMLEDEIPDEELRAKFTPHEPLGVKRIAKTPNYYRVVQQQNVHPVFAGIDHIEANGIVDSNGDFHEVDVIVWATGFDAHAYMRPMKVIGADGLDINDAWAGGVVAFKSLGVPLFPNFFLLCGPFAPVNSITIPTTLRDSVGYLMRLIGEMQRTGAAYAPTPQATDAFLQEIREALPGTTYSEGDNWYSQKVGTPIIFPFTRARHAEQYAVLDLHDFEAFPLRDASNERGRAAAVGAGATAAAAAVADAGEADGVSGSGA
ncbi:MAG: hapE 5 [Subtercola sp.]|nr:hapE 5 [Subtercola sp.]